MFLLGCKNDHLNSDHTFLCLHSLATHPAGSENIPKLKSLETTALESVTAKLIQEPDLTWVVSR